MRYFLVILICIVLQLTVLSFNPVAGIKPDLLLILVIVTGYVSGSKYGILAGLILGGIQDLFLGTMFSAYTIAKMILGGLFGLTEGNFFSRNYLIPPFLIFVATIIQEFLVLMLNEEFIFQINIINALKVVVLPAALYNAILGLVVYIIIYNFIFAGGKYYG